jgi:hypothetical protein
MILYGVLWQPLGILLAKDFSMSGKLCWYSVDWLSWDGLQVEQHPSNEIFGGAFNPWYIPLPRKESSSFCIFCAHDNG